MEDKNRLAGVLVIGGDHTKRNAEKPRGGGWWWGPRPREERVARHIEWGNATWRGVSKTAVAGAHVLELGPGAPLPGIGWRYVDHTRAYAVRQHESFETVLDHDTTKILVAYCFSITAVQNGGPCLECSIRFRNNVLLSMGPLVSWSL